MSRNFLIFLILMCITIGAAIRIGYYELAFIFTVLALVVYVEELAKREKEVIKTYEYKIVLYKRHGLLEQLSNEPKPDVTRELNELGRKGWEVVGMTDNGTHICFVMKRLFPIKEL